MSPNPFRARHPAAPSSAFWPGPSSRRRRRRPTSPCLPPRASRTRSTTPPSSTRPRPATRSSSAMQRPRRWPSRSRRRAGRHLHLGRSRLDGLSAREEADRCRLAAHAARQYAGAGRAQGLDGLADDREGLPACSQALGPDGKLAMASVDSVPAGKYGKAALTYLGVWDAVASRVAQAENVRAALAFVAKGEAPLGIVYGTDAQVRTGGARRRDVPRGKPSEDPLSRRAHGLRQTRSAQISRLPPVIGGRARLRGARLFDPRQSRLARSTMRKLSARNQLEGKVVEVKRAKPPPM